MSLRTIIACGGTGGHLFPGLAVAERLLARGGEPLMLISEKEIDALAAKGYDHLRFEKLPAVGMPPLLSPKIVPFALKFLKTRSRCKALVKEFEADAVLGMGGFTSLAPLMAGRACGAKTFIHESNAFPGKANRLAARFADVVLLGMEACAGHFKGREVAVVGTPLRESMLDRPDKAAARRHFGLEEGRGTVLVMGGSQGARGVNRAVTAALAELAEAGLQVLHLSGPGDYDEVRAAYEGAAMPHHVAPFCHEMPMAYGAADVAIARSGASSLAELSAFALPTVLVPFPAATDDHQTLNARVYSDRGAALLVQESELAERSFGALLGDLFAGGGAKLEAMRGAMDACAVRDAAERVCQTIEDRCARR